MTTLYAAAVALLALLGVFRSAGVVAAPPWRPQPQGVATRGAGRAVEDYRLPGDTTPTAYAVTLSVHLGEQVDNQFAFQGNVRIDVSVVSATSTITLHNDGLTITTLTVKTSGDDVRHIDSTFDTSGDDRQFMYIRLAEEVSAGTALVVEMEYEGELWNDMYGFYRSYYQENGVTKWLATTQFQPTYARRAFPCYDEPGIKAPFSFSFVVPASYGVLFNTRASSTMVDQGVNRKTVVFHTTPPMSSYLVAFIVSEFVSLDNELGGVWARQEVVQDGQYATSITKPVIDTMERLVGVPYKTGTIDKLDNVAIPDFSAGAMENWGLATYRERLILWADQVSDEGSKQRIGTVVSHELAHQWFGDLVSPRWWDVTWINEGFATFFEYFATLEVEPTWQLEQQFVVAAVHTALSTDSSGSSEAMTSPVGSPSEVMAHFSDISYDKGGAVIRMMMHILGRDVFYDGLNRYLKANALSMGSDELLLAGLEEAASAAETQPLLPEGKSFSEVMRPWINQPGYPLVTATRDYETGAVSLQQSRFLVTEGAEADNSVWDVPLTFTTGQERDFTSTQTRQWLAAEDKQLQLSATVAADDWLILNIQEVGFYRVNYDAANWALLSSQLQADHSAIGAVNRAQLLDDAFQLARAGALGYGAALDNTLYLAAEREYAPWYSALQAFSFLDNRLRLSEEQQLLQSYLRTILTDVSSELGYAEVPGEGHVPRLLRSLVSKWQCSTGVQGCLDYAVQELGKLMADDSYLVGPDMKSVVYCYGVQQAPSRDAWDFLWRRYSSSQVATEQTAVLAALGCTTDAALLSEYLSKTITDNSGIRSQDSSTVFSSTYVTPQGIEAALNFLSENFDAIRQYYGGFNIISTVVSGIAARLTTQDQLTKLTTFVNDNAEKFDSATLKAAQASLTAAQANMAWTDKHRDSIHTWLEAQTNGRTDTTTGATGATTGETATTTGATAATTGTTPATTGTTAATTGTTAATTGTTAATTGTTAATTGTTAATTGTTAATTGTTAATTGTTAATTGTTAATTGTTGATTGETAATSGETAATSGETAATSDATGATSGATGPTTGETGTTANPGTTTTQPSGSAYSSPSSILVAATLGFLFSRFHV